MADLDPLPADPVTALLRQRVRALFRQIPKALAGEEEPIHQMRVAGRRLRLALPLLGRKPGGRRVRRSLAGLRSLVRAGGGSRDLDVGLALLEERIRGLDAPSPELRTLRGRLRAARGRSHARMAEELLDLEIARLRRDLRALVARGGTDLFTALLRLRERRDVVAAELSRALAVLSDHFDPEALHAVRILARRLRYLAEAADAITGRRSEAPALFKELQEQLGQIHDAHVLALWLARQAAAAEARGASALAAEARAQEAFFLDAGRAHHRELLERSPAELLRRALEAMGAARTAA